MRFRVPFLQLVASCAFPKLTDQPRSSHQLFPINYFSPVHFVNARYVSNMLFRPRPLHHGSKQIRDKNYG